MRVLFDLTHPANVHLFKYLVRSLRASGDEVVLASRDKDVTVALPDAEGLEVMQSTIEQAAMSAGRTCRS
jgi:hypothetical protein